VSDYAAIVQNGVVVGYAIQAGPPGPAGADGVDGEGGTSTEDVQDIVGTMVVGGTNITVTYNDSAGTLTITGIGEATNTQFWTGTDSNVYISPDALFDALAPVTVAYGATITLNGNTGINFTTTLTGDIVLANPTNMKPGQSGVYELIQDATGDRSISDIGTNWKFPGGLPALSTVPAAIDVIQYFVRSDGVILASLIKAFEDDS
jgi:hypothetical protein